MTVKHLGRMKTRLCTWYCQKMGRMGVMIVWQSVSLLGEMFWWRGVMWVINVVREHKPQISGPLLTWVRLPCPQLAKQFMMKRPRKSQ